MSTTDATSAPEGAPAPFAEPTRRVGGAWIAAFAAAWLGIWMAQLAPFQLLLPTQVAAQLHVTKDDWIPAVVAFGTISGIAGIFAIIAFPLTGALSDRTTSRFGRRRPWIAGGAVLFALSLIILGFQTSLIGMGIFWSLAITGFSVLSAALTATISDQVPVGQRGYVSGWMSAPQAIGVILGLALVGFIITSQILGYIAVAVLLLVLVLPFLLRIPDATITKAHRPVASARAIISGMWISPVKYPDFAWTLASRVLVNVGNALGTGLLLYFLAYGLHFGLDIGTTDLIEVTVVYTIFVVLASLIFGRISDRIGRRKPFVILAALLQGIAAISIAFVPNLTTTFIGAAMLGLGYGAFLSVDQALATQVLPDAADRGKDLGIMNIANAVPQAVAPLLGAMVVAAFSGFTGLFLLSALASGLGAVTVMLVEKVR